MLRAVRLVPLRDVLSQWFARRAGPKGADMPQGLSSTAWDEELGAVLGWHEAEVYALAYYQDPEGLVGAAMTGTSSLRAHVHAAVDTRELFLQAGRGARLSTRGTVVIGEAVYRVSAGEPVGIDGRLHTVAHLAAPGSDLGAHGVDGPGRLLVGFWDHDRGQGHQAALAATVACARLLFAPAPEPWS